MKHLQKDMLLQYYHSNIITAALDCDTPNSSSKVCSSTLKEPKAFEK
jgi:hypothetical protein